MTHACEQNEGYISYTLDKFLPSVPSTCVLVHTITPFSPCSFCAQEHAWNPTGIAVSRCNMALHRGGGEKSFWVLTKMSRKGCSNYGTQDISQHKVSELSSFVIIPH